VITEITEYDPPRRWADRGISGPIRAIVAVTVEPLAGSSRSQVTIEVDFTGHGIGKLLIPPHRPSPSRQRDAGKHEAAQAAT
jgi:hypothetical protein